MKQISFALVEIIGGNGHGTGNDDGEDIPFKNGAHELLSAVISKRVSSKETASNRQGRRAISCNQFIPIEEGQFNTF